MDRRNFLVSAGALTASLFVPWRAFAADSVDVRLNLDATFLSNWPANPWLTAVEYYGARTAVSYGGKTIYISEIHYEVMGSRWKRMFVFQPTIKAPYTQSNGNVVQGTRPHFMVCLPGSDSSGNGAWDLIAPPSTDYQYQWPLAVAADNDLVCVAIDGPLWGEFEYPDFPDNPYDVLIDDICGVMAAKWYMDNTGAFAVYGMQPIQKNCYVGGCSWGGTRAAFLGSALKDCTGLYMASPVMSKVYDTRPAFSPSEWSGVDYADMLAASNTVKTRIHFGATDPSYTPFQPGIDTIIDGLVSAEPARFSKVISPGVSHAVNLADMRSFFTSNISPCLFYQVPEFEPEAP